MKSRDLKAGDNAIIGFVIVKIREVHNLPGDVTELHLTNIAKPLTIPSTTEVQLCDEQGKAIHEVRGLRTPGV